MKKSFGWMAVALALVAFCGTAALASPMPRAGQTSSQDKPAEKASASDPVSGDWDGLVELPDQSMAFSMKLKLDKAKITGEVGSMQGTTPITDGAWAEADAKVVISFTYVDGAAITLTGAVKDGQMTGTLNYGGQMAMNFVAKKKAK